MTFEILRIPLDSTLEEACEMIDEARDRIGGARNATVLPGSAFAGAMQVYVSDRTLDFDERELELAHYMSAGPAEPLLRGEGTAEA